MLEQNFDLRSHAIEEYMYVFEDVRWEMGVNCATSGIMLFVEDDVVFKVNVVVPQLDLVDKFGIQLFSPVK